MRVGDNPIGGEMKPGTWVLQVRCMERLVSKNGNPMLKATIEGVSRPVRGGLLWEYFVLTDSAIWKLDQLCQAIGAKQGVILDENSNSDMAKLTGKLFVATAVQEGEYCKLARYSPRARGVDMIGAPDAQGWEPKHDNQGKVLDGDDGHAGGYNQDPGWVSGKDQGGVGTGGDGWGTQGQPQAPQDKLPDIDVDTGEVIPENGPDRSVPTSEIPGGWPDDEPVPFGD